MLELNHFAIGKRLWSLCPSFRGFGSGCFRLGPLASNVSKIVVDRVNNLALSKIAKIQVVGGSSLLNALGGRLPAGSDPRENLGVIVFLQKGGKRIVPRIKRQFVQGGRLGEQLEKTFLLSGMHLQQHGLFHARRNENCGVSGIVCSGKPRVGRNESGRLKRNKVDLLRILEIARSFLPFGFPAIPISKNFSGGWNSCNLEAVENEVVGNVIGTIRVVEAGITDSTDDKKLLRTQCQFSKDSDFGLGTIALLIVVVDTEPLQFTD